MSFVAVLVNLWNAHGDTVRVYGPFETVYAADIFIKRQGGQRANWAVKKLHSDSKSERTVKVSVR